MTRADYARTHTRGGAGGTIAGISAGSPAARSGLSVGEVVLSADGVTLADVLDWQWNTDGDSVALGFRGADGSLRAVELTRQPGESWGIDFTDVLFDGIRTCHNNCVFCFMTQLPPGMRPALSVRDDDFRLSFLQGNFITLTNLSDTDAERIASQHLSPLYISLHAVDPAVREALVCAGDDRALERFDELLDAGIDLHVQVVLVPGINDGDTLTQTLTWLAEREGVESVGVVPLGFTAHQERFSASYEDPIAAATVIQQVQRWQFESRERDGVTWVHLADEFYLNARAPFPTAEWYDGYPQYENGIGLVRDFADEAAEIRTQLEAAVHALPEEAEAATLVTGLMAATTLAGALDACEAAGRVRLLAVPNRFFGGNVSVTGLLTGRDVADAIAADSARFGRPSAYVIPDIVFNADGVTLDDMDLDELRERSGADVRVVSCDAAGLLEGLTDLAENPPAPLTKE